MTTDELLAFSSVLKQAAALDRAVSRGEVAYTDIDPKVRGIPDMYKKKIVRQQLQAPAERTVQELAQRRALNAKLYAAGRKIHGVESGWMPGMGAGTIGGQIWAPPESGRLFRTLTKPFGMQRAALAVGGRSKYLVPKSPSDPTLTRAVLEHEVGESRTAMGVETGGHLVPYGSHVGVEPIVRENLALRGDPAAIKDMETIRKLHPDDRLVSRLAKQVGATPESPIPLGGRRAKALERRLIASSHQLQRSTRGRALGMAAAGAPIPYVPAGASTAVKGILEPLISDGSFMSRAKAFASGIAKGKPALRFIR